METNNIVCKVATEMMNTSMQDITAERIHGWATRLGATCQESLQVQSVTDCNGLGDTAKMRVALIKILGIADHLQRRFALRKLITEVVLELEQIAEKALAAPPRYCDVMSLESARKLWFAKEIVPRLDGDLPLGKEIPFEEWFVSQLEQEAKGEAK